MGEFIIVAIILLVGVICLCGRMVAIIVGLKEELQDLNRKHAAISTKYDYSRQTERYKAALEEAQQEYREIKDKIVQLKTAKHGLKLRVYEEIAKGIHGG